MKASNVLLALSLAIAPAALANPHAPDSARDLAEAEASRARARLTDAETALVREETRIRSLIAQAVGEEVELFRQKARFAKSLLIEARQVEAREQQLARDFEAVRRGLGALYDGEMLGARAAINNVHRLGIRPADGEAYKAARDRLLPTVPGANFRCYVAACADPAPDFEGGTVQGFVERLYAGRYDLKPVDAAGVEALSAVSDFADALFSGVDARQLDLARALHERVDGLMKDVDELSRFHRDPLAGTPPPPPPPHP